MTHLEPNPGKSRPDLSALKIDDRARRRGRNRWLRWFTALVGLTLLGFGGMAALRNRALEVEVAVARKGDESGPAALLNASGYVTPRRRATVAAKITGRLNQVLVDEGMRVEMGQVLATLDDSEAQVRLASARAERDATAAALADLDVNLANAERDLEREERLRREGVTTERARDQAKTLVDSLRARIALVKEQVRAAEARIPVAQQDLDNCTIRAPFDGIVVSKDAQRGEMVSPVSAGGGFTRTGIATIVDMNSLEIEVDVNESYIARVKPGQPVTATLDAYPDWKIPARVRTVIPTADRQKATVKVRISFDRLDSRILPDMGVKVSFLEEAKKPKTPTPENVVLVPREAVHDDAGQPVVFLYRENRLERRAVRLGAARENKQEIIAGVAEGDQLVIGSLQGLQDGQQVRLKQ